MMKKFVVMFALVAVLLSSCGLGFQQTVKNIQSDLGGGLDRIIVVENTRTGQEVFRFEGKAYIDDGSGAGDVTVVITTPNGTKKLDFFGRDYGVRSIEK